MKYTFLVIFAVSILACSVPKATVRKNVNFPITNANDTDKCFDLVVLSSQNEETELLVPVYKGSDQSKFKNQNFVIFPSYEYFERKVDTISNPVKYNDRYNIYCLKVRPAVQIDLPIALDTTKNKEFVLTRLVTKKYDYTHKKVLIEVACCSLVNEEFIRAVQTKLKALGYYLGKVNGIEDDALLLVLDAYCHDFDLPYHLYNMQLMKSLGIDPNNISYKY